MKKQFIYLFICILSSLNAFAQQSVSGTVTNAANGLPVADVSVSVKGTSTGTLTDKNGTFTLSVPGNSPVLVISSIGYETQEVPVGTTRVFTISLKESTSSLADVVIVGYGSQRKSKVTGSINTVKMAEVMGNRANTNVAQLLQGTVPGLQITYNTGEPGANTSLNIRGTTSIGSGSSGAPLILLDNVPVASLSLINPNDIESVTVLKDAGSAAVYGSRSAWGGNITHQQSNREEQ